MPTYCAGDYTLELVDDGGEKNRLIVKIRDAGGGAVNPDQVAILSCKSTVADVRAILPADCKPTSEQLLDIVTGLRRPRRRYWIFKRYPRTYRVDDRLQDPEASISWLVTRYQDEMRPGDIAFLWRAGPNPGICAVVRIDSAPQDMPELAHEQQYWNHPETQGPYRARGTITHRLEECLPQTALRRVSELKHLSVIHGFQLTTNFHVSPEEGEKLMELIEGWTS